MRPFFSKTFGLSMIMIISICTSLSKHELTPIMFALIFFYEAVKKDDQK